MKALQITKGRAVERVIPLSLLGYTEGVGKSEIEKCVQYSAEFDSEQKALWRTELFIKYAHRLLECSEQIFADERLFFTPLPLPLSGWVKNGGCYQGKHMDLVLGHIIDWWQNYKCAQVVDEEGKCKAVQGAFTFIGWGTVIAGTAIILGGDSDTFKALPENLASFQMITEWVELADVPPPRQTLIFTL